MLLGLFTILASFFGFLNAFYLAQAQEYLGGRNCFDNFGRPVCERNSPLDVASEGWLVTGIAGLALGVLLILIPTMSSSKRHLVLSCALTVYGTVIVLSIWEMVGYGIAYPYAISGFLPAVVSITMILILLAPGPRTFLTGSS